MSPVLEGPALFSAKERWHLPQKPGPAQKQLLDEVQKDTLHLSSISTMNEVAFSKVVGNDLPFLERSAILPCMDAMTFSRWHQYPPPRMTADQSRLLVETPLLI
jgi:hypothetical protein